MYIWLVVLKKPKIDPESHSRFVCRASHPRRALGLSFSTCSVQSLNWVIFLFFQSFLCCLDSSYHRERSYASLAHHQIYPPSPPRPPNSHHCYNLGVMPYFPNPSSHGNRNSNNNNSNLDFPKCNSDYPECISLLDDSSCESADSGCIDAQQSMRSVPFISSILLLALSLHSHFSLCCVWCHNRTFSLVWDFHIRTIATSLPCDVTRAPFRSKGLFTEA